jgi:hypothetical protein
MSGLIQSTVQNFLDKVGSSAYISFNAAKLIELDIYNLMLELL